ncbi:transcriptional regulator [Thecamonas trahens ATCC 50062]|uniref:protein acetyllysine N-acetyltransferase n=1 Tax=Thecamonas trahens ATCC 50062 TaxID=461836 RepID=A0A0L0DPU8_THETB|nr:transcriptional regulator [Thecamonas trahens ATCC 50062]KNC54317.1 transcriptional regulator [Thecamonas trahens ATCC 50062]|eukprot:XP_013753777.1 transcriptional regulator [Thecamonas trahens ATCC 50062]
MAHTAISDPEYMRERFDSQATLAGKISTLAEWIREADGETVIFTGAGISTSCGIPDFRSPNGVWTLKAQGRKRKGKTTPTTKAIPSATHMGIVAMLRSGTAKFLISQNCDGLHRRSGVPPAKLAELHGNSNIEYCRSCGAEYLRDWACRRIVRGRDHFTGRHCERAGCGGKLWDSTIDFGQSLPEEPLRAAYAASQTAALHIVFGSSLTVSPACDMPAETAAAGGRMVIVNLQKTPLTENADLHIYAKTDDVMCALLSQLGLDPPQWRLRRSIRIRHGVRGDGYVICVSAVDPEDNALPASIFRGVVASLVPQDADAAPTTVTLLEPPFAATIPVTTTPDKTVVDLMFMGHYAEPRLKLELPIVLGKPPAQPVAIELAYDPYTRTWTVLSRTDGTGAGPSATSAASPSAEPLIEPTATLVLSQDTSPAYMVSATRIASMAAASRPLVVMWPAVSRLVVPGGEQYPMVVLVGGLPSRDSGARDQPRLAAYQIVEHRVNGRVGVWFTPSFGNLAIQCRRECERGVLKRWLSAAAAVDPHTMVVFGGCDGSSMYNDLTVVRATSVRGALPTLELEIEALAAVPGGNRPAHRLGASLTAIGDGQLVLFGGSVCEGGPYAFLNDVHVFDMSSGEWTDMTPQIRGPRPSARAQHAAHYFAHANSLLVVGGTGVDAHHADGHVLDLDSWTWRAVPSGPGGPAAVAIADDDKKPFRITPAQCAIVPTSAATPDTVLVWGLPHQISPVHILDVSAGWRQQAGEFVLPPPLPATAAAAVTFDDGITALFGGVSGDGVRLEALGPTWIEAASP